MTSSTPTASSLAPPRRSRSRRAARRAPTTTRSTSASPPPGSPKVGLGNLVWDDTQRQRQGRRRREGHPRQCRVRLFTGPDCATEVNAGPDGILGTPDDAAGGMITDADGHYLFRNLDPGDYCVRIDIPAGYRSSSDVPQTANPNTDIDNDGTGRKGTGSVTLNRVTLTVGGEPTNLDTDGPDSNLTVDFGVFKPVVRHRAQEVHQRLGTPRRAPANGATGPDDAVHNPIRPGQRGAVDLRRHQHRQRHPRRDRRHR